MGFSVSGSAAIVLAGLFIGFGILYGAAANSYEQVSDAEEDRADGVLDERNSDVEIRSAVYSGDRLTVLVNNTGAVELTVDETDFIVDNRYTEDGIRAATVEGRDDTDLWLPNEQLNITVRTGDVPTRVKVVAGTGVADTAEVQ